MSRSIIGASVRDSKHQIDYGYNSHIGSRLYIHILFHIGMYRLS